jgi:hypothetical protein
MTTVITGSFKKTLVQAEYIETQLTSPTTTPARSMVGYTKAIVSFKVSSINTNVVLRTEVSNVGGTNVLDWDYADSSNGNLTITQNGTTTFIFDAPAKFIRTNFVSESGGTNATVDIVIRLST